jgi:hypothetical protein
MATSKLAEPADALYRVKRGLSAYVSYLAACEMNEAFSEYVLYEPVLRILTSRGYSVECEYECPGIQHAQTGDKKRIDFHAVWRSIEFAMEVKWIRTNKPNIASDLEKLAAFKADRPNALSLLCLFGKQSNIEHVKLPDGGFKERGDAVYADLRKTRYGCRIFELKG